MGSAPGAAMAGEDGGDTAVPLSPPPLGSGGLTGWFRCGRGHRGATRGVPWVAPPHGVPGCGDSCRGVAGGVVAPVTVTSALPSHLARVGGAGPPPPGVPGGVV